MEWVIIGLIVWIVGVYVRQKSGRATSSGVIPEIRPDMIHPTDRPLTRKDVADAYRNFYIKYCDPKSAYEVDCYVDECLNSLSASLSEIDDDNHAAFECHWQCIQEARRAIREDQQDLATAVGEEKTAIEDNIRANEAAIVDRTERIHRREQRAAAFKADYRGFLVDYINRTHRPSS
jgi:hypothetical protein